MRNHNHLLGQVDGVDGIKTGYTRASGFNLVTSVRRDGRHIVAVVLGGRSSGQRDARMRESDRTPHRRRLDQARAHPGRRGAGSRARTAQPAARPQLAAAATAPLSLAPPRVSDATATIPAPPPARTRRSRRSGSRPLAVKLVPPKQAPAQTAVPPRRR